MELAGCPACGAPAHVNDETSSGTVEVECVAHHTIVGPRELLVPRLPWDVPSQRMPMRQEMLHASGALRLSIVNG